MKTTNNQNQGTESQCCVDYCKTSFHVEGQEVVNNYKCDQRHFSIADMWNIQKKRKQTEIRSAAL